MRFFIGLAVFLVLWVIMAQSCMEMRTSDSTAIADFTKHSVTLKTEYVKINDHTLHYVQVGSDTMPTLFFVHGSPGSWDAFKEYLLDSSLRTHYRMISVDRPGFGYSEFGDAIDLEAQAVLLSALLKQINNNKPICLIGHSLGGPMVIKLAGENPTLPITNVVMLAGSVDPAEEKPENWRNTLDHTALRYLIPGAMRPSNAELLMFKKDVDELAKDFPNIKCRVLLMHGDVDDFVPPGNSIYAQKHLVNAKEVRIVWFKGQRHFIPWTEFAPIRDELLKLNMSLN